MFNVGIYRLEIKFIVIGNSYGRFSLIFNYNIGVYYLY